MRSRAPPGVRDKRDRLRQLRALCETVRRGSVTRAAEHLGITQPAVSLHLRDLEHELEATLLVRDSTGVSPTPAGERLYALAEPMVRAADSLVSDFARHLDLARPGAVRIAASAGAAAFVLPRPLARFREAHPDIAVRLDAGTMRDGFRRLLAEEVDLVAGPKESLPEETLTYHELRRYRMVLITALDHPLAGRSTVPPREAAAWPAVVPPAGSYSRQFGESAARALGVDVNVAVEVGGWGVLKRYVEAGFGLSVVPSLVVSDTDRLSVAELEWDDPPRSFGVYARRDRHLTPAARRFLAVLLPDAPGFPPPADSGTPPPGMNPAREVSRSRGRCDG